MIARQLAALRDFQFQEISKQSKASARYCRLEHEARRAKRGLWKLQADERIAPWEWRHRGSSSVIHDFTRETAEACIAAMGVGT